jgi:hypothetical protein
VDQPSCDGTRRMKRERLGAEIPGANPSGAPRQRVDRRAAVAVEHGGLNGPIGLARLLTIARLDADRFSAG